MESFKWSVLIGGLAFFFFGLAGARKGLQLVVGDRLRGALSRATDNRLKAFVFGAFVTVLLQSSGATSVMLVSFADTKLLTLFQAVAVLLGADFGTTFVVVLLSIKGIADIALTIVALGFFLELFAKRRRTKSIGSILMSFGLIFYGMNLMVAAAVPLKESEAAIAIFAYLSAHPLASIVAATIVAAAVHSAGMIGIAIALAFAGTISFEAAVPLVLGANIGTCVTAILAGLGSGTEGKRVAAAHTTAKIIGVLIAFPFIHQIVQFINAIDSTVVRVLPNFETGVAGKIAMTHVLFNIALAFLILPLIGPLIKLIKTVVPEPKEKKEEEFKPLYLDKAALETPALAFAQAKREILRLANIACEMFNDCLKMFSRGLDTADEIERIQSEDDKIDLLDKAIRFYLAEVATEKLSANQSHMQLVLLSITTDLEEIGDTVSKEMVMLARKKGEWHRLFSDEGWRDLRSFQSLVGENFNLMISILTQPSEEIATKVSRHEEHIDEVEQTLRQAHINRLHQGLKESIDTSSIHLDILGNIRRINSKIAHIVRMAMG
jgi:phosphate:Na+ symporter